MNNGRSPFDTLDRLRANGFTYFITGEEKTVEIKTVGVVGAGQMGSGIAQVASAKGFSVIMMDVKDEFVAKGVSTISKSLDRIVKKGTMTEEEKKGVLGRIRGTTVPGRLGGG